jgi:molybdopterin synthase catalytic subunit
MAEEMIARILEDLHEEWAFSLARVQHRIGVVPVGEAAILMEIQSVHRREAFATLARFMDLLKRDVPIWKTRTLAL